MAKSDTSKSKAEAYREERKERIAKSAKKNAKSIDKRKKVGGVAKKVVAIVIAVAIVLGGVWFVIDKLGVIDRLTTAAKIGDYKLSSAEFNYYYTMAYQQTVYYADYYTEQMGYNPTGYDTSIAPDLQKTKNDEGEEITWAAQFRSDAVEHAQFVIAYYSEALKANYSLTEDETAEINETVENYRESATKGNYSLSAYLRQNFGAGFNEATFKEQLKKEAIAQRFYDDKKVELTDGITDDAISEIYNADKKSYDYTDVRYKAFAFTTLTATDGETEEALAERQKKANAEVTAEAKEVFAKIKDEATFISAVKEYDEANSQAPATATDVDDYDEDKTLKKYAKYTTMSSSISEKGADWLFDAARTAGEFTLIEADTGCYIVLCLKPVYTMNSVSVRHCLIKAEAAAEDGVATDEEKAVAKKEADSLYKTWKENEATEEAFGTMAKVNTDDTASAEKGGLYDDVRVGQMVPNFEAWCFDPARKPGDTGIVESDYGYHIMYYVKDNTEDLDWKASIRTSEGEKAFETYTEDLLALDEYKPVEKTRFTTAVADDFCAKIKKNLALSA